MTAADGGDRHGQLAARAVALFGVLDQHRLDQLADGGRHVLRQRRRRLAHLHHRHRDRALRAEGPVPGQALVAHDAQGVDVPRRPGLRTAGLFGGDVVRGAHHHARAGDRHRVRGLGDAEVGQLHLAVDPDEDVARFDVAVHVAPLVRGLQCPRGLLHDPQGLLGVERAAGDQRRQRLAADELHHQVRGAGVADRAVVLAVVVHRGDPGVVERRDGTGLDAEPVQELRVVGQLGAQHLDRDVPPEPDVLGLPHLAHAADGDAPVQLVAAGDPVAGGEHSHRPPPAAVGVADVRKATFRTPHVGKVAFRTPRNTPRRTPRDVLIARSAARRR